MIGASSNPGEVVFDPFSGGGSTAACAMVNGRRFVGSELDVTNFNTTCRRLTELEQTINDVGAGMVEPDSEGDEGISDDDGEYAGEVDAGGDRDS